MSQVRSMDSMFSGSKYNHPLDSWRKHKVRTMNYMFYWSRYNHLLGSWDVSQVESMYYMFAGLNQYNHLIGSLGCLPGEIQMMYVYRI